MRPDELTLEEQLAASIAVAKYRKEQMDKIVFSTNVPETVAIKAPGRKVESRYNEFEVFYSLVDGRALYASPALAAKIEALAPAAGEMFSICKAEVRDGQRKRIEWQVAPVSDAAEPQNAGERGRMRENAGERGNSAPAPVAVPSTPRPVPANAPRPVSAPAAPVSQNGTMTQIMGGALVAAIDALEHATKYAEGKGIVLLWSAEDTRAVANSIFIQWWKDRETRARYGGTTAPERVNGGAAWQQ